MSGEPLILSTLYIHYYEKKVKGFKLYVKPVKGPDLTEVIWILESVNTAYSQSAD